MFVLLSKKKVPEQKYNKAELHANANTLLILRISKTIYNLKYGGFSFR